MTEYLTTARTRYGFAALWIESTALDAPWELRQFARAVAL